MKQFKELLADKDKAVDALAKCVDAVATADAAEKKAAAILAAAQDAQSVAAAKLKDAHQTIHDRLVEKGHHSLTSKDGTVSIYGVNNDVEEGWAAYHPIPGEAS